MWEVWGVWEVWEQGSRGAGEQGSSVGAMDGVCLPRSRHRDTETGRQGDRETGRGGESESQNLSSSVETRNFASLLITYYLLLITYYLSSAPPAMSKLL